MQNILSFASRIYHLGISLRNFLYNSNQIPIFTPPLFTISVGNISWGGTGKTPLCEWMLKWSHKQGLSPMLLTRGYRGTPPSYPYVVTLNSHPSYSGDEPLMLYKSCPFAKIIVDPKRERGIYFGWKNFKPDIAILDDGFQYRKLKRHLDILVFSITDLTKNWNKLIPAGSWREPKSSIHRAQLILINSTAHLLKDIIPIVKKRIMPYKKPVYIFHTEIKEIIPADTTTPRLKDIPDRYILVSGIGEPKKAFDSALRFTGKAPMEFLPYPDHYKYKKKDWEKIYHLAKKRKCIILCTPKDAVKLQEFSKGNLYTFKLQLHFDAKLNTSYELDTILRKSFFEYKSSHGHI